MQTDIAVLEGAMMMVAVVRRWTEEDPDCGGASTEQVLRILLVLLL